MKTDIAPELAAAVAAFCADVTGKATDQARYDSSTNVPTGIEPAEAAADPKRLIRMSLAGAVGHLINWEPADALAFAAEILEDSNLHHEAACLRSLAHDGSLALAVQPEKA